MHILWNEFSIIVPEYTSIDLAVPLNMSTTAKKIPLRFLFYTAASFYKRYQQKHWMYNCHENQLIQLKQCTTVFVAYFLCEVNRCRRTIIYVNSSRKISRIEIFFILQYHSIFSTYVCTQFAIGSSSCSDNWSDIVDSF
jgi:hypothetical protein